MINATTKLPTIRQPAISQEFPNAIKVEKMTIGLIIGAVNINAKAVCTGTPFLTN